MKTRIINRWTAVLSAWCVIAIMNVYGQTPLNTGNFDLRLTPDQTKIFPYEPVYLKYSFRNSSDKQQTITAQWMFAIYVKKGNAGSWDYYNQPNTVQASPPVPTPRTFTAGETIKNVIWLDVKQDRKHVFAEPGIYWVKVGFEGLESAPVSVVVQPSPNGDEPACHYLEAHPLYLFFTSRMATGNLDSPPGKDPVEELTEYVRLFPSSRYAQWVKLGVLWVKKARAGDDPDAVQAARANMEKEAPQFTNPMDAMCWYEAGIAAYRLGDEAGANANFNRAIAVDKQVFAREQVERVKRGEAYIRRLKAKDKEPTQESLKPIPQEDREAINNAIRQYFEAFGNGQLSQCKQMMTDDFKRGSSMDRERALKEMDEDLQKLKGRKLSIDPQIESMDTTDGTNINVQVRVIYHIADSQEAHRVALVMRKATGRWQIRTWNAVKMTRAEDDMGTGR